MNKHLTNTELIYICRQLALILKSGISALEGVSILLEDAASPETRKLLAEIYEHLLLSGNIAEAFSSTNAFPEYLIHMLEIGDLSGNLEETFISLADHYEREETFSQNIRSALSYPLVMLGMLLAVLLVLILKVMPVFQQVFMELGVEMSGLSLHILNLGDQLRKYAFVFLLLLLLPAGFLVYAFRFADGKKLLQKLPYIKKPAIQTSCARFASVFSIAQRSGLDIERSFELVLPLIDDPAIREKITAVRSAVSEGGDFADALRQAGIFSAMDTRMIALGFRTGSADAVFAQIADRLFEETDDAMQRIVSYIEPTLVAVLSILVGLILLSVMLPLVGIMSQIG